VIRDQVEVYFNERTWGEGVGWGRAEPRLAALFTRMACCAGKS